MYFPAFTVNTFRYLFSNILSQALNLPAIRVQIFLSHSTTLFGWSDTQQVFCCKSWFPQRFLPALAHNLLIFFPCSTGLITDPVHQHEMSLSHFVSSALPKFLIDNEPTYRARRMAPIQSFYFLERLMLSHRTLFFIPWYILRSQSSIRSMIRVVGVSFLHHGSTIGVSHPFFLFILRVMNGKPVTPRCISSINSFYFLLS